MTKAEPPARFGVVARWLHWTIALLLPGVAWLGWTAERTSDPARAMALLETHYALGLLVLALVAVRTVRRVVGSDPMPPEGHTPGSRWLAAAVHGAMYVLLWLLPVSGYVVWVYMQGPMDWFGIFELPRVFEPPTDDERGRAVAWYAHVWGGRLLAMLVALHLVAVAWHSTGSRKPVLPRMLGPWAEGPAGRAAARANRSS